MSDTNADVRSADRASVSVASAALLLAITVALAGVAGAVVFDAAESATPSASAAATVSLSASASAAGDRVTLVHEAGPTLDVRSLSLRITVAGTPLARQPPVPFFAARGFRSGPTGPFNSASDPRWSAGEAASLGLAGTNAPSIAPGDEVVVRVYVGGAAVATARTRAADRHHSHSGARATVVRAMSGS